MSKVRWKRERLEIAQRVLDLCKTPHGKTYLMYNTNMSYKQAQEYLVALEEKGFIEKQNDMYIITGFGELFLEGLNVILDLWNEVAPCQVL